MATAEKVDRDALRQLNLYEVLQVSPKASPEVVQAAYRTLARAYHPDVNTSPNAARMMRQLNAAYKVLSDPVRRARYDEQRAHLWRARPQRGPVEQPSSWPAAASSSASTRGFVADQPTPASINRTATYRSAAAVLSTSPGRSSWRIGRLIALLLFLMIMMGTLLLAFWMLAGALEDESLPFIHTATIVGRFIA